MNLDSSLTLGEGSGASGPEYLKLLMFVVAYPALGGSGYVAIAGRFFKSQKRDQHSKSVKGELLFG